MLMLLKSVNLNALGVWRESVNADIGLCVDTIVDKNCKIFRKRVA